MMIEELKRLNERSQLYNRWVNAVFIEGIDDINLVQYPPKVYYREINGIEDFSSNVQDIFRELNMDDHIKKMDKDGCLYNVVKAFSELDLSIQTFDSIKMGYIFENLIGRFYQNVDAGQFYTGRDIIKPLVSLLPAEGCDDIFDEGKVITVCDQA